MGRSNPCILRSNCEVICVLLCYCLSERDFIKRVLLGIVFVFYICGLRSDGRFYYVVCSAVDLVNDFVD